MKLELSKTDTINSKNICMVDSGTKSIHLRKMVRTLRDEDLFDTIEDFVKQGGEQGSGAIPVFSEDLSKTALSLQANGYRGTRKFRTFSDNVTAFNSDIAKGESVDVVVTDSLIYDKGFDYGFVKDGVAYSQNGGQITTKKQTRNLAYSGSFSGKVNGVTISYDNGIFTLSGTSGNTIQPKEDLYKKVITLSAGSYTMSVNFKGTKPGNSWVNIMVYGTDEIFKFYIEETYSFTITEETKIYIGCAVYSNTYVNYTLKIQIESGTTATDWVPPLQDVTYTLQHGLKFDGAHYVDSGIKGTQDTHFIAEVTQLDVISYSNIIGARDGYRKNSFVFYTTGSNKSVIEIERGNRGTQNTFTFDTTRHRLEVNSQGGIIIDDNTIRESFAVDDFTTNYNLIIAGRNDNGTITSNSKYIIYCFLLNDLIFVPAQDEDGTVGLLELNSLEFKPLQSV